MQKINFKICAVFVFTSMIGGAGVHHANAQGTPNAVQAADTTKLQRQYLEIISLLQQLIALHQSNTGPMKDPQTINPNKNTLQTSMLQKELEVTYAQLKSALNEKNSDRFLSVFEPVEPSKVPSKEEFAEAAVLLETLFPDLSNTKFIRVNQKGDLAAYYYQSYLDNPNFNTLDMLRFRKINNQWKISGQSYGYSWKKNEQGSQSVDEVLKNKLEFQL